MASESGMRYDDPGFSMDFAFDVVEVQPDDIEEMARQSTVGCFESARKLYEVSLKKHSESFPVFAEFLRLLFDQWDFATLLEETDIVWIPQCLGVETSLPWTLQEHSTFALLRAFGQYHVDGFSEEAMRTLSAEISTVAEFVGTTSLTKMDETQILALVLLLNSRYLQHETRLRLPDEAFSHNGDDLSNIFSYLLSQKHYWAAEHILEVCFRRANAERHLSYYEELWRRVVTFLATHELEDHEAQLWAKAAILQTFCEGLLRRELSHTSIAPHACRSWTWSDAMLELDTFAKQLTELDDSGDYWAHSRGFIRHELSIIDKRISDAPTKHDLALDQSLFETLHRLRHRADTNHDWRLGTGIQWRIDALVLNRDWRCMTSPPGIVPLQAYARREQSTETLDMPQSRQIRERCCMWWNFLIETSGGSLGSERPRIAVKNATPSENRLRNSLAQCTALFADHQAELNAALADLNMCQLENQRYDSAIVLQNLTQESTGHQLKAMQTERAELLKQLDAARGQTSLANESVAKLQTLLSEERNLNASLRKRQELSSLQELVNFAYETLESEKEKNIELQHVTSSLRNTIDSLSSEIASVRAQAQIAIQSTRAEKQSKEKLMDDLKALELKYRGGLPPYVQRTVETHSLRPSAAEPSPRLDTPNIGQIPGPHRITSTEGDKEAHQGLPSTTTEDQGRVKVDVRVGSLESLAASVASVRLSKSEFSTLGNQKISPNLRKETSDLEGFRTIHGQHRPDGSLGGYRKRRTPKPQATWEAPGSTYATHSPESTLVGQTGSTPAQD